MSIKVHCPNPKCGKRLEAPDSYAGRRARCPHCKEAMTLPDPQAADPLIGAMLGVLQIEKKLGQGAMGAVYLGTNTRLDRKVAVKILPVEMVKSNPSYLKRFHREAKMAAMLSHPSAVMVYTVGEDQGRHYMEMEYVQGVDLREVIRKHGRIERTLAARIVKDVAGALGAAHRQGIVHRDVKPDNIMLTQSGQIKVTDFGLAKIGNVQSSITLSGQVFGTPLYMSPEHGQDKPLDGRADIYSLGATYYHLLVGSPPFIAKTPFEILMMHLREPISWPPGVEDIPPETRAVIERMTAKQPQDRFQTCEEVVQAIEGRFAAPSPTAGAVQAVAPVQQAAAAQAGYAVSEAELAGIEPQGAGPQRSAARAKRSSSGLFSTIPKWFLALVGAAALAVIAAIVIAMATRR